MSLLRPRPLHLAAAVAALGLLASSCGSDADAVSFGDQSLSRSELDAVLDEQLPATADGNHSATEVAGVLSQFIFAEAIAAELDDRGFPLTDGVMANSADEIGLADTEFDPDSQAGILAVRIDAIGVTFDEWIGDSLPEVDAELPEYMCASHILVETEDEAVAIGDRLAEGEDFAELAIELSTGPSGPTGGDLSCAATAGYVPEFSEGAREVAPSGVTGPVQSDFGWHVISVRSFGPLTTENHPEIDPATIATEVEAAEAQAAQAFAGPLVEEIRVAAFARVDRDLDLDSRYGTWEGELGVVPPDGVTDPDPVPVDPVPVDPAPEG